MPELPEVETSRRGIAPYLLHQCVSDVIVRQRKLRWPIPETIAHLNEQVIDAVERRAKYLLLKTKAGVCIIHLGMSGSLRIVDKSTPVGKHDHVDWCLANGNVLRLCDPRRFGAVLWWELPLEVHPLLSKLGPEPLTDAFNAKRLYQCSRGRTLAVKQFIMDNAVVVGVGNIYANEALFHAGIHPKLSAGQIGLKRYEKLAWEIKAVLTEAIKQGGTTLRDFSKADGKPGYFKQELAVYGRDGLACPVCGCQIQSMRIGQRNTFYCPNCQKRR
ncbi:bifunctional DNA-formamidopyrimidine glycosylase/DNA-(apurinic or apyrimidinic site) lyase [Celerinatantimonas diazotrophica]|uniref:Formamidopyrimidine-DNA glycosylase n=1 Tax=Celerinatantimonas diazotrophica TaxID=412034 RepID=A0A4R1J7E4_9GAMM|nr:bifunctional DNA-formamidopyrimidine glycosylase/DNA-(apurinic or apyrimidinic site) lyase [Celerinatantimonas diazotrophica]TCK46375.1 DNA-(apurinic or apyrimidinic site) lyase [Celerinatantimonas diazotrophica]CAG9295251.1 Formamidopyrimidine-DNA glycosylase [Celerinatantimonas diazotrophica]